MRMTIRRRATPFILMLLIGAAPGLRAQTDEDAIMMSKQNFCVGGIYSHSSWNHYWEGTFRRDNKNLGTVSTQMFGLMGTYGVSRKLNVLINAPYVTTHVTAGTLHDQHGIQDLSLWVKWLAAEKKVGNGVLSLYVLGGGSLPLTNYIADYLPLSIGLHSKTLSGRLMVDYQLGNFFVTASATRTWRDNIRIDRNSYYTTELHLTNDVDMPDMAAVNLRSGYRSDRWIIEAVLSTMTTLGGFDIRKNDMPFPSNKMDAAMVGAHFKYNFKAVEGLSLTGGANFTLDGLSLNGGKNYVVRTRNVGQSKAFDIGVFYILNFSHKAKAAAATPKTN